MDKEIEQLSHTFQSPHPYGGNHIISGIETCARTHQLLFVETKSQAPTKSGEEQYCARIQCLFPTGEIITLYPTATPTEPFLGGAPYDSFTATIQKDGPISVDTKKIFDGFLECLSNKF